MKLIVRLRSVFRSVSAYRAFSSKLPVVVQGDLISGTTFFCGSSMTLLQSKVTLFLRGASNGLSASAFGTLTNPVLTGFSSTSGTVNASITLVPQVLQNLAPSGSLLPQLLQNTILPPLFSRPLRTVLYADADYRICVYIFPCVQISHTKKCPIYNYSVKYYTIYRYNSMISAIFLFVQTFLS